MRHKTGQTPSKGCLDKYNIQCSEVNLSNSNIFFHLFSLIQGDKTLVELPILYIKSS